MWRLRGEGVIEGTVFNKSSVDFIYASSSIVEAACFKSFPGCSSKTALRLSLAPSPDGFPLAAGLLLPTRLLATRPKGGLGSRGVIRFIMLDTCSVSRETAERLAASAEC
jgi:hypothetical protein